MINPVMRTFLLSPLARVVSKPIVLLQFAGRKSGRTYRIVVGWHDLDGGKVVFSPAPWTVNFRGGAAVSVTAAGKRSSGTGTLIEDAEIVAAALQEVLDSGTKPRDLGLLVPHGHRVTALDVRTTRRAMIRLDLAATTP